MRNCQAFAADFYSFAVGKKGIEVFSPYLRPLYTQRTHLFLYSPELYDNPTLVDHSRYASATPATPAPTESDSSAGGDFGLIEGDYPALTEG